MILMKSLFKHLRCYKAVFEKSYRLVSRNSSGPFLQRDEIVFSIYVNI